MARRILVASLAAVTVLAMMALAVTAMAFVWPVRGDAGPRLAQLRASGQSIGLPGGPFAGHLTAEAHHAIAEEVVRSIRSGAGAP